MTKHMCDPGTFDMDDDGFYFRALCTCGWRADGGFPGIEDVVDALMGHAYERGREDA